MLYPQTILQNRYRVIRQLVRAVHFNKEDAKMKTATRIDMTFYPNRRQAGMLRKLCAHVLRLKKRFSFTAAATAYVMLAGMLLQD